MSLYCAFASLVHYGPQRRRRQQGSASSVRNVWSVLGVTRKVVSVVRDIHGDTMTVDSVLLDDSDQIPI
jgi:hypothetical protein